MKQSRHQDPAAVRRLGGFRAPALVLSAAVATLLLALPAQRARSESQPPVLLKAATLAPEGSTWMRTMDEMDTEIRAATGNAVGFKFYPNMVQGDEQVVLRRIRNAQLQAGGFTGAGLGEIAPVVRVLELPFLFQNEDEVDAIHAALDAEFERALEEKGFVLLGWAEVGPIYLFTNIPVRSREDMSRVKMWLWEGDPVAESLFHVFDIPPIPLSIAHVMTALQTGMVDGIYSSPYGCIALQWFTRTRYMTDAPAAHATGALVVSAKAFERIPVQHRDTVRRIARQHLDRLVQETRRENADALAELAKHGVQRVSLDEAQLRGFRERARLVWDNLSGKLYSPELLKRVIAVLDERRASSVAGRDG